MTVHLPWPLVDGRASKVNKMSYTHPNPILLDDSNSMRQSEHMRKNPFWYFRLNWLWLFIFQFGCSPKSTNHIILVSAHPIPNLKINMEISRSKEFMVKTPFLYFYICTLEFLVTLRLPWGLKSSSWPQRNFWKMGFHFFTKFFHFLSNLGQGDMLVV